MSRPATRPLSTSVISCSRESSIPSLFHGEEKRETVPVASKTRQRPGQASAPGTASTPARLHNQIPLGLIALAMRLHAAALAQVLVHDPSLRSRHRVQLNRFSAAQRLV